ncbi:MAG TPA: MFS transporter, partial [Alphaproteobacteria bacterium]|nr:MFS transporter [Alphaproteobacteria bacterium]
MFSALLARLDPVDDLDEAGIKHGLGWLVRNGIGAQGMETLAAGTFLAAFALQLGASNLVIGLLAAVPQLTQFLQLPTILLVERLRRRRLICVLAGFANRPALLLMGLAAFVPQPGWAIALLIIAFVLRYSLGAVVGCSWNSWVRDLVPEEQMGRFFGGRMMRMTLFGLLLGLLAAGFVDLWRA